MYPIQAETLNSLCAITGIPEPALQRILGNRNSSVKLAPINSVQEARDAFYASSPRSLERNKILKRWVEVTTTVPEVLELLELCPKGSEAFRIATRKWHDHSYAEALGAKSYKDSLRVFRQAPPGGAGERVALENMASAIESGKVTA